MLGSAVPLALNREIPPVKVFFNVAQFTLGTCVALAVFELLAGSRDALDPGVWSATLLAVFATAFVADVTIGAAAWPSPRPPSTRSARRPRCSCCCPRPC